MHKLITSLVFLLAPLWLIGQTNFMKNAGFENDPASGENIPYSLNGNIGKGQVLDTWVLNYSGGSSGNLAISTDEKRTGLQSMQLNLNTIDARYRFYAINDIKNLTADTYELSFYAKADQAGIPFRIDVAYYTGTNNATEKHLIGSSYDENENVVSGREGLVQTTRAGWAKYTIEFTLKESDFADNAVLRISILPNCTTSGSSGVTNTPVTYWFDDFDLSVKQEEEWVEPDNYIKNEGFENNPESGDNIPYSVNGNISKGQELDTWVLNYSGGSSGGVGVTTEQKRGGLQSMQLNLNSIDARYRFYLSYDIKKITAGTYQLSFYAKGNQAGIPFRVDVAYCTGTNYATEKALIGSSYDEDGNVIAGREGIVQVTRAGWAKYTVEFTMKEEFMVDNSVLRLSILPNCNTSGSSGVTNTPATYWFDDFNLSIKQEEEWVEPEDYIKNGSFENDIDSGDNIPYSVSGNISKGQEFDTWVLNYSGASSGSVSVTSAESNKGAQSMEVDLNSIDMRYRFYLSYDIKKIVPGTYKLTFYAKANVAGIPFRADIAYCTGANYADEKQLIGSTYDSEGNVLSGRDGVVQYTQTGWSAYSHIFTLKDEDIVENSILRLYIRPNCLASGSSGVTDVPVTYWLDDFSLSLKGETDFSFEEGITSHWVANEGTINVSTDHFKDGAHSLQWTASGNDASLSVNVNPFAMTTATSFYLYNPSISDDMLLVEFREGDVVKKVANVLLNFKGWRDFSRSHTEFESSAALEIDNVTFRRKTQSTEPYSLFFDDVKIDTAPYASRQYGYHMVLDKEYFTTGNNALNLYSNPIDIELTEVTAEDQAAIDKLTPLFKQRPTAGTEEKLQGVRDYIATLNISRNEDGSVKGNIINTMAPIDKADMIKWAEAVELLAASTLESDKVLFNDFVDYLLDQGIGEGVNFSMVYSDYTTVRAVPKGFLSALDYYNEEQKEAVLKLVCWIADYGKLYFPEDQYLSKLNADVITNYIGYFYTCALNQPQTDIIVRDLKAVTRFLERNIEYVPGSNGILKIDGTGFHHNSHYNNYMYSFRTWINYVNNIKGTPFRISLDAYGRMKNALVSMYTMATRDTDAERFTGNSLSGRAPYMRGGLKIPIYKAEFRKMVEIGGDIMGQEVDNDLASAYNYFFMTNEYPNAISKNYEGFYQFNYSPTGIYRKNNWVTIMRSPTTKFWGAEIYSGANRFGRYQSHGTMEIMYDGTLATSGYPTTTEGGGWDWNVIPGSTTVHYTSWKEMMPGKNTTQRFDQYALTKNFAGALAWGDYGIFAADFDQIDTWGGQWFTPTNLTFKKSVFAFDEMLICMGSDISASGTYSDDMITATNLFQGIISDQSGDLVVNGNTETEGYDANLSSTSDVWMITPQSTGFYIPKGNDDIVVKYGSQTTPKETGADAENPTTTAVAAKAYLNHGVKTADHGYYYIAVPDANVQKMQAVANAVNDPEAGVFEVKYHNSAVHALEYKPQNMTAYSIFEPVDNLETGLVKSAATQMLLMVAQTEDGESASFAVNNPNHNPVADPDFVWMSTPTYASVTLQGQWEKKSGDASITTVINEDETLVTMTLSEGLPTYFDLKKVGTANITTRAAVSAIETESKGYSVIRTNNGCDIRFNDVLSRDTQVRIIDIKGRIVLEKKAKAGTTSLSIDNVSKGIYVIQVVSPEINESVKFIF